ncbi:hypothetical protein BV20DRAFT_1056064 [Pilatotrama ljubarskyi]|nr:hypothetical protein BV20DRAFT_1056064 [Pilatotrama ljubarskyi]
MEANRDSCPLLPLDVLEDVMAVSTFSTISALMQACWYLYDVGPRHLLGRGVTFTDLNQVPSFDKFARVQYPRRFSYIRTLDIALGCRGTSEFVNTHLLVSLVSLLEDTALRIETLVLRDMVIRTHPTHVRALQPRALELICNAIEHLQGIRHVAFGPARHRICQILRRTSWQLITVDLECVHCSHLPLSVAAAGDPSGHVGALNVLQRCHRTLRSVRWNCAFALYDLGAHLTPAGTFAHVRKLGIAHLGPARPGLLSHIASYVRAFPNITELEIIPANYSLRRDEAALSRLRTQNQEEQARHGMWSGLTRCSGDVLGLFALGLLLPVSHLECVPRRSVPLQSMGILRRVLSDARPTSFSISLHGRKALLEEGGFVAVLCNPATQTIREILVEVRLAAGDVKDDASSVMEDILQSLRSLPTNIQTLDLILDYYVINRLCFGDNFSRVWTKVVAWLSSRRSYEKADLAAFAGRIRAAVSHLTAVTVRFSDRCVESARERSELGTLAREKNHEDGVSSAE